MNKVHVINAETKRKLEDEINAFAKNHEIVNVALTVKVIGYFTEYTAVVIYKEG